MPDPENLRSIPAPGSLARMHVPPGVEILVDEVFGTEDQSPAVELKSLLSIMAKNDIHLAGLVPLSPMHVIVIGYRDSDAATRNEKSPPAAHGSQGARKR